MSKNAFYFFMLDWAKEQERRGLSAPKNFKELSAACSDDWKNLSSQKKGIYKARAKQYKIKSQSNASTDKKTTTGESLALLELQEKKEQEFHQNMLRYIESVVSLGVLHNNLPKLKFIFIHTNWFCKKNIGINKYEFFPAEFAVAEFSIENGIEDIYHELLKPKIPLGWRRDAIEISQQTHQIPINLEDGENDFSLMYDKFTKFLDARKTGNKYPPLFTLKDLYPAVESLLMKMIDDDRGCLEDYLIYSIEALFTELRNTAIKNVSSHDLPLVIGEYRFSKDYFSDRRGYECDFHKIIDVTQYCSKSIVTRWGFLICDYCCDYLDIEMIEGVHRPHDLHFDINIEKQMYDIQCRTKKLNIEREQTTKVDKVSIEHKNEISQRSDKEKLNRWNADTSIDRIDNIKPGTSQTNTATLNMPMRPLRAPKTTAQALEIDETIDPLNEVNFPPIGGRGTTIHRKNNVPIKLPLGRGRGRY
ncbi:protein maelstrom homolog [Frieseomelitta varia]|uniref:protein maelstrom homolog n=1 Tax=Frieseomelitta varia TaxID=561572 RepID=UPI001CB6A98F|nr:protein maelstrom homolog [Frieseomelitta varia]